MIKKCANRTAEADSRASNSANRKPKIGLKKRRKEKVNLENYIEALHLLGAKARSGVILAEA